MPRSKAKPTTDSLCLRVGKTKQDGGYDIQHNGDHTWCILCIQKNMWKFGLNSVNWSSKFQENKTNNKTLLFLTRVLPDAY